MKTHFIYLFLILYATKVILTENNSSSIVAGYYLQSWVKPPATPPAGTNLSICFTGLLDVKDVLANCAEINTELAGKKFLSFGGGTSNGSWSLTSLSSLNDAISAKQFAGWDGICYDIELGDAGLGAAFAASFANAKSVDLSVLVTISHSQPYGITDASTLMTSFISNQNITFLSPQLYTTGLEATNDFTAVGTTWDAYALSQAKILPSVVLGVRDFPLALTFFSKLNITLGGFVQWTQGTRETQSKLFYFIYRLIEKIS